MADRKTKKAKRDREEEIEERLDLEAIRRSLAEPGQPIPWATLKKELNL